MQGLKVPTTIVDEIARLNEIVDGWMHGWTDRKLGACVTPCHHVQNKKLECSLLHILLSPFRVNLQASILTVADHILSLHIYTVCSGPLMIIYTGISL